MLGAVAAVVVDGAAYYYKYKGGSGPAGAASPGRGAGGAGTVELGAGTKYVPLAREQGGAPSPAQQSWQDVRLGARKQTSVSSGGFGNARSDSRSSWDNNW